MEEADDNFENLPELDENSPEYIVLNDLTHSVIETIKQLFTKHTYTEDYLRFKLNKIFDTNVSHSETELSLDLNNFIIGFEKINNEIYVAVNFKFEFYTSKKINIEQFKEEVTAVVELLNSISIEFMIHTSQPYEVHTQPTGEDFKLPFVEVWNVDNYTDMSQRLLRNEVAISISLIPLT